jgi:hypothetical protein
MSSNRREQVDPLKADSDKASQALKASKEALEDQEEWEAIHLETYLKNLRRCSEVAEAKGEAAADKNPR